MGASDTTCWTVIRGAAEGVPRARDEFARRYEPVVRAYLGARWRGGGPVGEIDDAVQEVFLDCFREGGALGRVEAGRPGGFHAFLHGVVRNVALRAERARARRGLPLDSAFDVPDADRSPSEAFDRAWAHSLLRQAVRRMEAEAAQAGEIAARRVELLRLRFREDLPIRAIAERWGIDAARLHHDYATARQEFRRALGEVVAEHRPGSAEDVEGEVRRLISCFE